MPKPLTVDHNKLWKILKEMGIPDHLTCLLRNLYVGQEAAVRNGHGPTDWFQIGKGVSVEGFPWWTFSLQGKDFLQVCKYLRQQSHVMPLFKLMTSNNPKMDWCNTLYFNYGHNVTFHFGFNLF